MVGRPGRNAPGAVIVNRCLERRLVGEPVAATAGIGGPGVIGLRSAAAALSSTIPALVAAPAAEAAASAGALGLGDLGRRVAQGRADLVDLDLVDGALLAFLGLVRPLLEPALHDDPHPALERFCDVLSGLPPDVAGQEQRLAVLPFIRLPVHE